jgi:hypothetical protein
MAVQPQVRDIVKAATPSGPKNYSGAPQYIDPESDRYHAILRDLQAGDSYWAVSKRWGICRNTARRIAHRHGITRNDPKVYAASEARRNYTHAERVRLTDLALERLENLLADVQDTRDLQHLCNALAVLIHKRRLMDGEVTQRTEIVRDDSARKSMVAKLDALAARQRSTEERT